MRALVFGGPWDLAVQQRPDLEPGPDEVLIDVLATGICGSDLHGYTGESGRRVAGQVMGHETVGRIAGFGPARGDGGAGDLEVGGLVTVRPPIGCGDCRACAEGADQLCADRRVIGVAPEISAAFAEQMAVPAGNVVPLPETMPVEYGALVEPLAVGYHAAVRGGCRDAGERLAILVIGGGPIGQAAALAARRLGQADIVVSEPDAGRRDLLAELALPVVDPSGGDLAGSVESTVGRRPDLVLDAVGSSRSLADALGVSRLGATVVLVGMHEPELTLSAYAVSTGERAIVGSFCYSPVEFAATAEWVGAAPAELATLIQGRVDLDGAPAAFRRLADGSDTASKVLVTF